MYIDSYHPRYKVGTAERKIKYYGLEFRWEYKGRFEAEVAPELGFQGWIIFEYWGTC